MRAAWWLRPRQGEVLRPHERLDAYHVARRARALAYRFTKSLPPGFGDEARQINNAAASVVRNTAEGANRWRPAEKVLTTRSQPARQARRRQRSSRCWTSR